MPEGASDEEETQEFVRRALPTWHTVERLVDEQRTSTSNPP